MKSAQFYKELGQTRKYLKWYVDEAGGLRARLKKALRLNGIRFERQECFCPITAVALLHGELHDAMNVGSVQTVKLGVATNTIIEAADDDEQTEMRMKLEQTVGLK